MPQLSKVDQKRITFLSLLGSAATIDQGTSDPDGTYDLAGGWLTRMEEDGFFEADPRPTPSSGGRNETSEPQASPSKPSSRGRDQARGGWNGQMRDPDGPPSRSQIGKLLSLTDDYTWGEAEQMTKREVSDLISRLVG